MAEEMLELGDLSRAQAYELIERQLDAVLDGVTDDVARMSTVACVLHHGLGFLWTGFYRVTAPGRLEVGPYQGSLGCMSIDFGRGVCGRAAAEGRTVVVPEVTAFPGHIACDARSRSEIVVPVFDARGEVRAVLDIDSAKIADFGADDVAPLERLVRRLVSG